MSKNIGKNISKNLSRKYSQKLLDHAKQSCYLKKSDSKISKATGNKIANKITKVSKNLQQNNSKTVTNGHDKEITKEKYIFSEKRREIVVDLRLI